MKDIIIVFDKDLTLEEIQILLKVRYGSKAS